MAHTRQAEAINENCDVIVHDSGGGVEHTGKPK